MNLQVAEVRILMLSAGGLFRFVLFAAMIPINVVVLLSLLLRVFGFIGSLSTAPHFTTLFTRVTRCHHSCSYHDRLCDSAMNAMST